MEHVKKLKAYITYEMTPTTRSQLLEEISVKAVTVRVDGRIYNSNRMLPDKILADLIKTHKAEVIPTTKIDYHGRTKLFGVHETLSRTIFINKQKFIRIRVLADNLLELMEKISTIKTGMAQYGVKEKICIWDKVGKLNTRIGKEPEVKIPFIKSEFSSEELHMQRKLELETRRDDFKDSAFQNVIPKEQQLVFQIDREAAQMSCNDGSLKNLCPNGTDILKEQKEDNDERVRET